MSELMTKLRAVKNASYDLMLLDVEKRKTVLLALAKQLRESVPQILIENQNDLAAMDKNDPKYDRLLLSQERIEAIAKDVEQVANLPHRPAAVLEEKELENGLKIQRVTVPLGVVAIIYESRPNVTIDSFVLCFKTGNACILKGGKEAFHSNKILVSLIRQILHNHQIDEHAIYLFPPDRKALDTLLKASNLVDVCIPRGSQSLINFVREHARIPFIETGAGIVHTYFDASGDVAKGRLIVNNAKTRRVSVCNALDTLIIHEERLGDLAKIVELLADKQVELFADKQSYAVLASHYPGQLLHQARPEDFGQEFLSYKMSIKTVDCIESAMKHIMEHTSGHSEAIIAEDEAAIRNFLEHIDAAAVYVNASTAFTDGGQFGLGAEIGISTQKLHARGPMALDALTSYKWIVQGNGHIRS